MRYGPGHKQKTRQRIVSEAARLFREAGYQACGVDAVMKSAGLTPGGFYSHFDSKDALLAEALEHCLTDSVERLSPPGAEGGNPLEELIARYLSPRHRDAPGIGCPIPALGAEVSRQTGTARTAMTRALRRHLSSLGDQMPDGTPADREDRAIALLASLAGGMLLARAVDDAEFSDRILKIMRRTVADIVHPPRKRAAAAGA